MKKLKLLTVVVFAAMLAFACGQTKTADNSPQLSTNQNGTVAAYNTAPTNAAAMDELASAKQIYSEKCVKCHKEDGKGGVTDFDGTKIKAPDLTSDRQKAKPDSDYISIIEKGAKDDGMPAFKGKISDDDIKNLVRYIRRDFQGK